MLTAKNNQEQQVKACPSDTLVYHLPFMVFVSDNILKYPFRELQLLFNVRAA